MPCFHPIPAQKPLGGGKLLFGADTGHGHLIKIACGQCVGCRLQKAATWAARCMHEASLHACNSFVTLTYSDEHLKSPSLDYRDFQLFLKRARKKLKKLRYYAAGEYGELTSRPHFHAILFGVGFTDATLLKKTGSGRLIYTSKILESLWPHGFSSVGECTFESAAYVARYCMKKITGLNARSYYVSNDPDPETGELKKIEPEMSRMSLKPGIGGAWAEKFSSDIYPSDFILINGHKRSVPRYYGKILENKKILDYDADYLLYVRQQDIDPEEQTKPRLAVKEQIAKSNLTKLMRKI